MLNGFNIPFNKMITKIIFGNTNTTGSKSDINALAMISPFTIHPFFIR